MAFTAAYHLIIIINTKGHSVTSWKAWTTPHFQGLTLSPFWLNLLGIVSVPEIIIISSSVIILITIIVYLLL